MKPKLKHPIDLKVNPHANSPLFDALDYKQRRVAGLLVDAKSPKEIAGLLLCHFSNVSKYSAQAREKLGIKTVPELLKWFWQNTRKE